MSATINYWAVLASAVASMIIGSIWYGPLFGKRFMQLMGMNEWSPEKQAEMKKSMAKAYLAQFIASCVMFYVLSYVITAVAINAVGGIYLSFWAWLGFIVPLSLSNALWGGKLELFWLSIGNMLLTLVTAGAIIGAWR